ncbi:hypothetical protein AB0C14_15280 [Microbispora hainanensis]|uniref:hypothetical protein n=1 Tax=Microbispora hainanensis TaxID=568844 RepID=UPI0033DF9A07
MTHVRLRPLGFREDEDGWIVGRVDTGVCIEVPYAGKRAIELLGSGRTILATREELRAELGVELDVSGFVDGLAAVGMVASIGDRVFADTGAPAPSLPWITPGMVRWTLNPLLHCLLGLLVLGGVVAAVLRPDVVPRWHALLWSDHGTVVLLSEIALVAALVSLHEFAHLLTARAAGVPGRIRMDTRLQFLAAQTDVSGVWLAERRTRLTVYLAGMAVDASVLAGCLLTMALSGTNTLLSVIALTEMTGLALQFFIFMRTDLYFLLQDLARCRNLYADAAAFLLHLLRRAVRRPTAEPLTGLNPRQRRFVRIYSVLLVAGTALCLGVFLLISVPFTVALVARSLGELLECDGLVDAADALLTLGIVVAYQAVWVRAWVRRHGPRVRGFVARLVRHRVPGASVVRRGS